MRVNYVANIFGCHTFFNRKHKLSDQLAVQRGDYKVIRYLAQRRWQLRTAETDRVLELNAGEHVDAFKALRREVRRHRKRAARAERAPEAIEVTSEEMQNLRQLGYIQ